MPTTIDGSGNVNSVQIALANQGQAEEGLDNATLMTPLRVAQAIGAIFPEATYTSPETSIPDAQGGVYTFAHGLGKMPKLVRLVLRCITDDITWTSGTEVYFDSAAQDPTSGMGHNVGYDATNIYFKHAYLLLQTAGSTGNRQLITASRWRIVVYAWA